MIDGLRALFGRRLSLEFRMDAAFFPDVFRLLGARGYAIKVGAAERQRWHRVAANVTGFFHDLDIPQ